MTDKLSMNRSEAKLNSKVSFLGVILAGGSGTRLYPLTKHTPKPLLPVGGRPMVFYVLDQLVEAGITDIVLVIKEEMLEKFQLTLGEYTKSKQTTIKYVFDPKDAKGLIPALSAVESHAKEKSFLVVTCGDVLTDRGFNQFVKDLKIQLTGARILGLKTADTAGYSPLTIASKKVTHIGVKDKTKHGAGVIDSGTYAYPTSIFQRISKLNSIKDEPSILDLNNTFIDKDELFSTVIDGWWSDVGNSLDEYYAVDKKFSKINNLSFTVGIPSYKSGQSLVESVKSLRESKGIGDFEIMIIVDDVMNSKVEKQLKKLHVKIIKNKNRGGQTAANNQVFTESKTDITILTQDDVKFAPDAIAKMLQAFISDPQLTMISPKLVPFSASNFFEHGHHFGVFLVHSLILKWKGGDNYLSSVGRCLAFRTPMIKKFEVSEKVINCDAYYYFENQRLNGKYKYVVDAIINYHSPNNLSEHTKQIRKFVVSQKEISDHLGKKYSDQYSLPKKLFVSELIVKSLHSPLRALIYAFISVLARVKPKSFYDQATIFWEIDKSTKNI